MGIPQLLFTIGESDVLSAQLSITGNMHFAGYEYLDLHLAGHYDVALRAVPSH